MPHAHEALEELLSSLFGDADALRRFVRHLDADGTLANLLPGNVASHTAVAHATVQLLEARKLVDRALMADLCRRFPTRTPDIRRVAEQLGIDVSSVAGLGVPVPKAGRRAIAAAIATGLAVATVATVYTMPEPRTEPGASGRSDDNLYRLRFDYHEGAVLAVPLREAPPGGDTCVDSAVVIAGRSPSLDFVACKAGFPPKLIRRHALSADPTGGEIDLQIRGAGDDAVAVLSWNNCVRDLDDDQTFDSERTHGVVATDLQGAAASVICECFDEYILSKQWDACIRTESNSRVGGFLDEMTQQPESEDPLTKAHNRWVDANVGSAPYRVAPVDLDLVMLAQARERADAATETTGEDADPEVTKDADLPPEALVVRRFLMIPGYEVHALIELGCPLALANFPDVKACQGVSPPDSCACLRDSRVWYSSRVDTPMHYDGVFAELDGTVAFSEHDNGVAVLRGDRLERFRVTRGFAASDAEYDGPQISELKFEDGQIVACGFTGGDTGAESSDGHASTGGNDHLDAWEVKCDIFCRHGFAAETDCRPLDMSSVPDGPLYRGPRLLVHSAERKVTSSRNGCLYKSTRWSMRGNTAYGWLGATLLVPRLGERCPASASIRDEAVILTTYRGQELGLDEACDGQSYHCIPVAMEWQLNDEVLEATLAVGTPTGGAVIASFTGDAEDDQDVKVAYEPTAPWLPADVVDSFHRNTERWHRQMADALDDGVPVVGPVSRSFSSLARHHADLGIGVDDRGQVILEVDGIAAPWVVHLEDTYDLGGVVLPVGRARLDRIRYWLAADISSGYRFRLCDHC